MPTQFYVHFHSSHTANDAFVEFVWLCNATDRYKQHHVQLTCHKDLQRNLSKNIECRNLTSADNERYPLWQSYHFIVLREIEGNEGGLLFWYLAPGYDRSVYKTWSEASQLCGDVGGHLPVLNSREDVRHIAALLMTSAEEGVFHLTDAVAVGLQVTVSF